MGQRIAGLLQLKVNGVIFDAKGEFSYGLGTPKREEVMGADGYHGYKETPQVAFIEGAITDRGTLDLQALATMTNATVTIDLANGKMISLRNADYAGEGTGSTGESEVKFRFIGKSAREIT